MEIESNIPPCLGNKQDESCGDCSYIKRCASSPNNQGEEMEEWRKHGLICPYEAIDTCDCCTNYGCIANTNSDKNL